MSAPSIAPPRPPAAAPVSPASAVPPPSARPAAPDLTGALFTQNLPREHGFEPLAVDGRIPDDLRGTLFRTGPGLFELLGQRVGHPFEADGAVTAVRLDDAGAWGAVKLVQSQGLVEERAAGRRLYGNQVSWPRRIANLVRGKNKNIANTSALYWQHRLFALMEGGLPTELDPSDLRTIGETDLDGTVVSWFSAHPHRVASRRTTYNFGLEMGRRCRLHLYALPDQGRAQHLAALDLDGLTLLHDFIATDEHLIFFVSPLRIDVARMLSPFGALGDAVRWRPELGTEIIVVPIDRPTAPVRFHAEAFFQWHFANAFQRGRELVVDYVRSPDARSFGSLARMADRGARRGFSGRYHRAVIDVERRTFSSSQRLAEGCEYPRIHPGVEGAPHRYAWLTTGDYDGIGRLDVDAGALIGHRVSAHQRVSEPIFVPRAGAAAAEGGDAEADGHVLALCYDGERDASFLAIYDGLRLADGPVARCWLDHRVPVTFHGTWAPAAR